ncbi:glycosyltransferase family 61 protein [Pseudoscourfieldia marina]
MGRPYRIHPSLSNDSTWPRCIMYELEKKMTSVQHYSQYVSVRKMCWMVIYTLFVCISIVIYYSKKSPSNNVGKDLDIRSNVALEGMPSTTPKKFHAPTPHFASKSISSSFFKGTCVYSPDMERDPRCIFRKQYDTTTPQVRHLLRPPILVTVSEVHNTTYLKFLENKFELRYEWNSFPDLISDLTPRRAGLYSLPNACVDILQSNARRFNIESNTMCFVRHYRRGEAMCSRRQQPGFLKRNLADKTDRVIHFKRLYFNAYGRNSKNFQHFLIDHLGPLSIAYRIAPPDTRFLVDVNPRSLEIIDAAAIPRSSLIHFARGTKYCAKELYLDFVEPIDQVYVKSLNNSLLPLRVQQWRKSEKLPSFFIPQVSLPEHFMYAAKQLEDGFIRLHNRQTSFVRDAIVFASRAPVRGHSTSASGVHSNRPVRNVRNEKEIISFLMKFSRNNGMKFVLYRGAAYDIKSTQEIFLRAKVIIGVHGANMANQIFAGSSCEEVHVVEIVGMKQFVKYENYQSYWYDGWSCFNYSLVQKQKKDVVDLTELKLALHRIVYHFSAHESAR